MKTSAFKSICACIDFHILESFPFFIDEIAESSSETIILVSNIL